MIIKTRSHVKIPREDWEKMKKNPALSESIELMEDMVDYKASKLVKGKDVTLEQYLQKRGLRNNN